MAKLAGPTIAVLLTQTLVGVVETFFVARLGTDALAGVSLVFPLWMLMIMMSNGGIGGGVAASVARATGAGRREDASALVFHALVLAIGFGVLFTASMLIWQGWLYRKMGGTGVTLVAAMTYSTCIFAGAVPIWIANLMAAAMRGSGNVVTPAKVTLLGSIALVAVSPVLIFGFGPVPALGVAGAGVAVVAYYVVAAAVLLRLLRADRDRLRLRVVPLELRLFWDILRVGLFSAAAALQPILTVVFVTAAVGRFGAEAIAGYGIASRLDYVMIPILFGLGTAVVTMVGANVGAGNRERSRRIAWVGAIAGFCIAESVGLLVTLWPELWLRLFSNAPAVVEVGTLYLHWTGPLFGAIGIGMLLGFAAQGGGRMLWPFLAGSARMLIAGGLGWWGVTRLQGGLSSLFAMVGLGAFTLALICVSAAASGAIWPRTWTRSKRHG